MIKELLNRVWWRFMPGTEFEVPWPSGELRIKQEDSDIWDYVRSADPNDWYRPDLEAAVGKQGWDWDFKVGSVVNNTVCIKIRKGKDNLSSFFVLKWTKNSS